MYVSLPVLILSPIVALAISLDIFYVFAQIGVPDLAKGLQTQSRMWSCNVHWLSKKAPKENSRTTLHNI